MVRKTKSNGGEASPDTATGTAAHGRNGVGKDDAEIHCAGTNGRGQGGGGGIPSDAEHDVAPPPKPRGRRKAKEDEPPMPLGDVCMGLQRLQRHRAVLIKSRNMQANRLQAVVAGNLGYYAAMDDKERKAKFQEASKLIKATVAGQAEPYMAGIIRATMTGVKSFNDLKKDLEKEMVRFAKRLPVAAWVGERGQRGFGLLFLAIVVGETGDLFNYPNPAKVWRRLGCAPWTFQGETKMGATWRSGVEGKLPSDMWADYGYSPRRRSISYLIGEGIVKQNRLAPESVIGDEAGDGGQAPSYYGNGAAQASVGDTTSDDDAGIADPAFASLGADADLPDLLLDEGAGGEVDDAELGPDAVDNPGAPSFVPGPYLLVYLDAKAKAAVAHPDWPKIRLHRHGMLLATKRLLLKLWRKWHGHD